MSKMSISVAQLVAIELQIKRPWVRISVSFFCIFVFLLNILQYKKCCFFSNKINGEVVSKFPQDLNKDPKISSRFEQRPLFFFHLKICCPIDISLGIGISLYSDVNILSNKT